MSIIGYVSAFTMFILFDLVKRSVTYLTCRPGLKPELTYLVKYCQYSTTTCLCHKSPDWPCGQSWLRSTHCLLPTTSTNTTYGTAVITGHRRFLIEPCQVIMSTLGSCQITKNLSVADPCQVIEQFISQGIRQVIKRVDLAFNPVTHPHMEINDTAKPIAIKLGRFLID